MQKFEKINIHEHDLIRKVRERTSTPVPLIFANAYEILSTYFTDEDNTFTNCMVMIETEADVYIATGSAKRMTYAKKADKPDCAVGKDIAFTRAIRAALDEQVVQVN